jgi:hypothetical protein
MTLTSHYISGILFVNPFLILVDSFLTRPASGVSSDVRTCTIRVVIHDHFERAGVIQFGS